MADSNKIRTTEEGCFLLPANVQHDNAQQVMQESVQRMCAANTDVVFDLSQLESVNSLIVAILLECLRTANKCSINCKIQSPPKKLLDIIALNGLNSVFENYLI